MAFSITSAGTVQHNTTWTKYNVTTTPASQLLNGSNPMNVFWNAGDDTISISGFPATGTYTGKKYFRWNGVNYIFYGQNFGTSGTTRTVRLRSTESSDDGDPQSDDNANAGLDKALDTSTASPVTAVSQNYTGATTLNVTSTAGFPEATTSNPQQGIIGTDVFTYTGQTATTLTGVASLGNHNTGAEVRPLIDIWEADDLHDLMTALNGNSAFTASEVTAEGGNERGMRIWSLSSVGTNSRFIINCTARIVHEDVGETLIRLTAPSGGRTFLQLCGYTASGTTNQPRVTLGALRSGIAVGQVTLRWDHNPSWGTTQPGDNADGVNAVAISGGVASLKPDTHATRGGTKYFFLMGLGGPGGYFETVNDGRTPVYNIQFPEVSDRFDFDTWDGGMTGEVAMSFYGSRNGDFAHPAAGAWTPITLTCPFKDIESKSATVDASANEVTGLGGGSQNSSQVARLWTANTRWSDQFQRVDISKYNTFSSNTSIVAYDYPNPIFRNLDYNADCNHSIVYTPGGAKPAAGKLDIKRVDHGATGGRRAAWHYLLGITPNIQDTNGLGHDNGWMLADRTYESGVTATTHSTQINSGSATLTVTDASELQSSGSIQVSTQTAPITYTGITGNVLGGIPTSGTGSITSNIPGGTTVTELAPFTFSGYSSDSSAINRSTANGKSHASFNPDLVHLDSGDSGSLKRNPSDSTGAFGYYAWELDGKEDGDKRGGVLQFGVNNGATENPSGVFTANNYYYRGQYDVYFGSPGRPTIRQTLRPLDFNGVGRVTNQAPIISHNLYPGLSLASNGRLSEEQGLAFEDNASTGTNLLNLYSSSNDFRTWSTGATHNCTRWLATVSSIPYIISRTWSAKSRGSGSSPASGTKYADWDQYRAHDGHFARIAEWDGDFIQSVSGSKFTIKNPGGNDLTINCNFKPVQDSTYDTIEISDGGTNYGNWDLNSGGLECDASSNPHAYLQGNLTDVRTYTTLENAKAGSAFTVKGHDRMKGTMTVNVTNTDVYVSFKDCSIATGESFQIIRTGTGTGRLFAVNPPTGTTIVAASGATDNNSIVQEIQVTRPAIEGESSVSTVQGRLSLYNGSTLIRDFVASGTGVSYSSGTVTYDVNTTESGITIPSTDFTLTTVWSGPGGVDHRSTRTKSSGALSFEITLAAQDLSPGTASVPAAIIESFTVTDNLFTIGVGNSNGNNILNSTTGTWKWLDEQVKGTANYNDFVRRSASNVNQILNQGDYAQIYGARVTITVNDSDAKDQSLGYIQNLSTGAGNGITASNTIGGTEYFVYLTADAPGNSVGALRQALGDYGTATTTDVNNARNQTIGALS